MSAIKYSNTKHEYTDFLLSIKKVNLNKTNNIYNILSK